MKRLTKFVLLLLVVGVVCCVTAVRMGVVLEPFVYQEKVRQQDLSGSEVHRLVLDIDTAKMIIRRSDAEKRSLTAGKSTEWETNGDTLTIRQQDTKGWFLEKKPADIILTLTGGDAETIDLELNGGSVSISDLYGLQYIKCDIEGGTAEITDVLADKVKADVSDAGRLTFTGRTLGPVQLSCENGYIRTELQKDSTIGQVNANIDGGEIEIITNGKSYIRRKGIFDSFSSNIPDTAGDNILSIACDSGGYVVTQITTEGE